MALFLQDYLNIEIINLYLKTSETQDEAKLKLERMGRRMGRKLTEMFLLHLVSVLLQHSSSIFVKCPPRPFVLSRSGISDMIVNVFWPHVFRSKCSMLPDDKV